MTAASNTLYSLVKDASTHLSEDHKTYTDEIVSIAESEKIPDDLKRPLIKEVTRDKDQNKECIKILYGIGIGVAALFLGAGVLACCCR